MPIYEKKKGNKTFELWECPFCLKRKITVSPEHVKDFAEKHLESHYENRDEVMVNMAIGDLNTRFEWVGSVDEIITESVLKNL